MMKITGLSHLFKWENLHNWWLTKYFFAPLYVSCTYIHPFSPNEETFTCILKRHFHGNLIMLSYIHIQTAYKPWQSSFLLFTLRVKKSLNHFCCDILLMNIPMITCKHVLQALINMRKQQLRKHLITVMFKSRHINISALHNSFSSLTVLKMKKKNMLLPIRNTTYISESSFLVCSCIYLCLTLTN